MILLAFIAIVLLCQHRYVFGSILECKTGQFSTLKYRVTYLVHTEGGSEYCRGGLTTESLSWPRKPSNFIISALTGNRFQLTWNPPADGSAKELTGFRIEMYEEPSTAMMRPEPYCFYIQLFIQDEPVLIQRNKFILQDAVFTLNCHITVSYTTTLRVFINSLPPPVVQYDFDGQTVAATFNEIRTSTLPVTTSPNVQYESLRASSPPGQKSISPGITAAVAALSVGATVCVGLLAGVLGFFRCQKAAGDSSLVTIEATSQQGRNNSSSGEPETCRLDGGHRYSELNGRPTTIMADDSSNLEPGLSSVIRQQLYEINSIHDLSKT